MKTRYRFFGLFAAFLLVSFASLFAGERHDKVDYIAKLKAELNLSDAQVTQLQQKFQELKLQGGQQEEQGRALRKEIETLAQASPRDDEAIAAKKRQLEAMTQAWHDKWIAIFRTVLTPEQFTKWDQMQATRVKEERREWREKEIREREHHEKML